MLKKLGNPEEFAVIATGGKQYIVWPGETIKVEKLAGDVGGPVSFSEVLLIAKGENISIGKPTVPGAIVKGEITKQGRNKKVVGVKFKPKKRQKKTFGHRQSYTEVKIKGITSNKIS